jgi:hypothetical protein
MEVSYQLHAPVALPQVKGSAVLNEWELVWMLWRRGESTLGIELTFLGHSARSLCTLLAEIPQFQIKS